MPIRTRHYYRARREVRVCCSSCKKRAALNDPERSDYSDRSGLRPIPVHGGYRKLRGFQVAHSKTRPGKPKRMNFWRSADGNGGNTTEIPGRLWRCRRRVNLRQAQGRLLDSDRECNSLLAALSEITRKDPKQRCSQRALSEMTKEQFLEINRKMAYSLCPGWNAVQFGLEKYSRQ